MSAAGGCVLCSRLTVPAEAVSGDPGMNPPPRPKARSSATHIEALTEIKSAVGSIVNTQRLLSQHQAVLSSKLCGSVETAGALCAHLRDLEEEKLSISAIERWVETTCEDMAQLKAQALFLHKVVREDVKARGKRSESGK